MVSLAGFWRDLFWGFCTGGVEFLGVKGVRVWAGWRASGSFGFAAPSAALRVRMTEFLVAIRTARTGARCASEKQVLRCAQNDN